MRKKAFVALSLLASAALVSCQPDRQTSESNMVRNLDSMFRQMPDFSGVVLLADAGKPVYHKSFGYKDINTKTQLDTGVIFELASVSKQFTAMIVMMLKEQGRLSYDDDIKKYVPALPYDGITIRHLLNHTSGLPDYQAIMDQHWDKSKVAGNAENIAYLIKYHPKAYFSPGEKYEYSNTGYMLLASIAEKASGADFIELCREWIFRPLGMTQTDIRSREDKFKLKNMAWGQIWVPEKNAYIHADSFPAFNYSIWLGNRKGPGRMSSTASDLLRWDQALYQDKLVERETLSEALSPATLNDGTLSQYGFGWRLNEHPVLGRKIFHTGDNPGYKTIIIRYVDARKTLILLCNNAHEEFHAVVGRIETEVISATGDGR